MTTVTDEMVEVAQNLDFELLFTSRLSKADRMRAVLEAALAVMPAPDDDVDDPNYTIPLLGEPAFVTRGVPVDAPPTDAEFEAAVDDALGKHGALVVSATHLDRCISVTVVGRQQHMKTVAEATTARRTLLALHAQAKQQGLRDIRDRLHDYRSDDPKDDHQLGVNWLVDELWDQIDAMLGGSHE